MTRRARLAIKLAACALAGAVVSVGVAWLCAVTIQFSPDDWVDRPADPWPYQWPIQVDQTWPKGAVYRGIAVASGKREEGAYRQGVEGGLLGRWSVVVTDSGFPLVAMRALWTFAETNEYGQQETYSGIRLNLPSTDEQLPLSLLWPGFALDTLFYGGLVFLLWSAPGVIRRRVRKRRGRCPACGYDLRGSGPGVCPECGTAPPNAPAQGSLLRASTPSSGGGAQPRHSA